MPITGRLISFVFGFLGAVVLRIVPCLLGLGENCRNMEKFFRFLHGSLSDILLDVAFFMFHRGNTALLLCNY